MRHEERILNLIDKPLSILLHPIAWILKKVRVAGIHRLPSCRKTLLNVGLIPIINHYYEPQFDFRGDGINFEQQRNLPGIDFNIEEQLALIGRLIFSSELENLPESKTDQRAYYLENTKFKSGDAEFWYQIIRLKKPKRIIEIGSGHSTLMAIKAITMNKEENPSYDCNHICIEPYEFDWLEQLDISVHRVKVEDTDLSFFSELQENDMLFIDSSHVIRPAGDVLFEYLQILPSLNNGVIVHIHDIFTPRNYLREWLENEIKLWNEQYLLEAFLTHNKSWKIIGALNYLHHNHYDRLKSVARYLSPDREPGSFYMQKIF
jgi:hypothetical protein